MKPMFDFLRAHSSIKWILPTLIVTTLISFQNCGQSGSLHAIDGAVLNDNGDMVMPAYSHKSIGTSDSPPLKLIFLMDNSNSMTLNNLNLQQSLTSMFDNNATNLSQFNADIYFYTTAQLSGKAKDFSLQTRSPSSLGSVSLFEIENAMRGPTTFNGLIAGDLLGYETRRTINEKKDLTEYLPQPVVAFRETTNGRQILPSIHYSKGSSIQMLKANVKERLDIISPERASNLTDASAFTVLDTESALCGMARILKAPGQTIRPGDIASFIIVSDENESDIAGNNCLDHRLREYLYSANCEQRVPASVVSETTVKYQTLSGVDQVRTDFQIRTPDTIKNKIITTLKLTRSAKNANCSATQQREFYVDHEIAQKSYFIQYSKKPVIGIREGGIPIYGPEQTGLKTSNQPEAVPPNCTSDIAKLRSIIGDSTSSLTIQSCNQNPETNVKQSRILKTYAAYPGVNLAFSTACPASLLAELSSNGSKKVVTCVLSMKTENISSSALANAGFGAQGSESQCKTAVAAVCSSNPTSLRSCEFKGYTAAVTADTKTSVPVTDNVALSCNSLCSRFPGLCTAEFASKTVKQFASSIAYTCSPSTVSSIETFVVAGTNTTVSVVGDKARSCTSTCSEVPSACGNQSSALTIAAYNQSCSASTTVVPGGTSQNIALPAVLDAEKTVNCSTLCSQSKGVCTGSLTIAQHIGQNLNGKNCTFTRADKTIPEKTNTQTVTRLKESELLGSYCPAGYEKAGPPQLTKAYEDSAPKVSGDLSLSDFILAKLNSVIGSKSATLTAFITPNGGTNSNLSISYGQAYEAIVKAWKSGSVNDIRSPSYAPALTQLSATLKSQLIRSVVFPEVTGQKRIRQVWHLSKDLSDWQLLPPSQWSATGGTVTLDESIDLDFDDQLKIEYY